MKKYIPLDDLVAEIERIKKEECPIDTYEGRIKLFYFERFLSFLDIIEVKEMNLEKEFCDYFEKNFRISISGILLSKNDEPINTIKLLDFAKHFFELGMGVSNKA